MILNKIKSITKDPRLFFATLILGGLSILALFAKWIAPHDPSNGKIMDRLLPPSTTYLLGTEGNGADVLSCLIYGAQTSLFVSILTVILSTSVGILIGSISGYFGGKIDTFIMRVTDLFMAFPGILLALAVAALLGPGIFNLVIAISITGWTAPSRLVRQEVLALREREFVQAARSLGASHPRILVKHIIPLTMAPLMIQATFALSAVIITESSLSFLGLGSQETTTSWGSLLSAGKGYLDSAPHISLAPGLAIMAVVIAFNFLGDYLQEKIEGKT